MKKSKFQRMLGAVILFAFIFITTGFAEESTCDKPPVKQKWLRVKIQAIVEDIDKENRKLTLKGTEGNRVTLTATERVERFDEIKVGDSLQAEYLTFLRAEFREPTPEEKENPLVVLAEAGKAPKEIEPAGLVGVTVRAVVKVVSISTEEKKVAIQGPRGNFLILPVEDEAVMKNLKVGEVVIMTSAEAVALSLSTDEK
jgi:hypothetical protein